MPKLDIDNAVYSIVNTLNYQEESIVSRTILRKSGGNITIFAFDTGQELSEHKSSFDALVLVLEGVLEITVGDQSFEAKIGEALKLPSGILHSLHSSTRSKMLLIMING